MLGPKSFMGSNKFHRYQLAAPGTLTAADGKDEVVVGFERVEVVGAIAAVDVTGDTGGDTSVQLNRVRAEVDAALLSSTIDIDHDDADGYAEADKATLQNQFLQKGDLIRLDVDSIPTGTASAGLAVEVIVRIHRY